MKKRATITIPTMEKQSSSQWLGEGETSLPKASQESVGTETRELDTERPQFQTTSIRM